MAILANKNYGRGRGRGRGRGASTDPSLEHRIAPSSSSALAIASSIEYQTS